MSTNFSTLKRVSLPFLHLVSPAELMSLTGSGRFVALKRDKKAPGFYTMDAISKVFVNDMGCIRY